MRYPCTRGRGLRRRRDDRGAVAVEFALILIPFLALVFGIIQYGVYFWAVQGGSAAARDAARRAAVGQPESCTTYVSDVQNAVDAMTSDAATVTRDYNNAAGVAVKPGDDVTVTVRFHAVDFGFPFVPFINGGQVSQAATARVEYVPSLTLADCS